MKRFLLKSILFNFIKNITTFSRTSKVFIALLILIFLSSVNASATTPAAKKSDKSIEIKSDDNEGLIESDKSNLKSKNFQDKINEDKETVKIDLNNADAHYKLGVVYDKQGKLIEAITEYKEAIRINPDDKDAHRKLGALYDKQGKFQEAIKEYQEAIRINPDGSDAHFHLGLVNAKQGNIQEAIEEFIEYVKLSPGVNIKLLVILSIFLILLFVFLIVFLVRKMLRKKTSGK